MGSLGLPSKPNDYFQDTKDLFKHRLNKYNYLQFIIQLIYPRGIGPNYPMEHVQNTFCYMFVIYTTFFTNSRLVMHDAPPGGRGHQALRQGKAMGLRARGPQLEKYILFNPLCPQYGF